MLKMFATNDFKIIKLRDNSISCEKETHPLIGVSARVENGSDIEKRVTFTRLLLLGIFAFAMQKKKDGEKYLCIEGPDFAWMTEVKNKDMNIAMRFATEVNNAAKKVQLPRTSEISNLNQVSEKYPSVNSPAKQSNTVHVPLNPKFQEKLNMQQLDTADHSHRQERVSPTPAMKPSSTSIQSPVYMVGQTPRPEPVVQSSQSQYVRIASVQSTPEANKYQIQSVPSSVKPSFQQPQFKLNSIVLPTILMILYAVIAVIFALGILGGVMVLMSQFNGTNIAAFLICVTITVFSTIGVVKQYKKITQLRRNQTSHNNG